MLSKSLLKYIDKHNLKVVYTTSVFVYVCDFATLYVATIPIVATFKNQKSKIDDFLKDVKIVKTQAFKDKLLNINSIKIIYDNEFDNYYAESLTNDFTKVYFIDEFATYDECLQWCLKTFKINKLQIDINEKYNIYNKFRFAK